MARQWTKRAAILAVVLLALPFFSRADGPHVLYIPFVVSPPLCCEELMVNGGFEDGPQSWELFGSGRVVEGVYDWPEGQSGLLFWNEDPIFFHGGGQAEHWMFRPIPADAKRVTLSFWYRFLPDEEFPWEDAEGNFEVYVLKPPPPRPGEMYYQFRHDMYAETGPGWHHELWDVSALAGREVGSVHLMFSQHPSAVYQAGVLVDNVSLEVCR